MSNSSKYYDSALLSEVSYVLFHLIDDITDEDKIKEALLNKNAGTYHGKLTIQQAEYFIQNYQIISHQDNTDTGFSATLFKKIGADEYYYASRGTEPGWDDLVVSDAGNIVVDGLAFGQIVDMYNDWQRITATKDQPYECYKLEVEAAKTALLQADDLIYPFGTGPYELYLRTQPDVIIDRPLGIVYTFAPERSDTLYSDARQYGLGGTSIPNDGVTAVGHSLGGHLSNAFARLFGDKCSASTTINGAGFMTGALQGASGNAETNIRNLFDMLGGSSSFLDSDILNIYGEKFLEMTTMNEWFGLKHQGAYEGMYIEDAAMGNTLGHGKEQMTDSLAVYDLFIRLDPGFQTNDAEQLFSDLNPIFDAAENGGGKNDTLERIVNIFGEILIGDYQPLADGEASRELLYEKITAIHDEINNSNCSITNLTSFAVNDLGTSSPEDIYALINP